jgi:hypothetical protein
MKEYILERIATLKSENKVVRFPIEKTISTGFQIRTKQEQKIERGRESYFDYWGIDE